MWIFIHENVYPVVAFIYIVVYFEIINQIPFRYSGIVIITQLW